MGEELVSAPSSQDERGGATERPSSLFAYLFPTYLAWGMSYNEYWCEDVELAVYYRKAHEIQNNYKNQELWLQGMYILEAIICTKDKEHRYPTEPYPLNEQQKVEIENRKAFNKAQAYMENFYVKNNLAKEG